MATRCTVVGVGDAIAPALFKKLSFDFVRDFAALARICGTPNLFVVHPSVPVKSVKAFIALAKAQPGKLEYAAAGMGTSGHLSFELFKSMTGTNAVFVPYKAVARGTTTSSRGAWLRKCRICRISSSRCAWARRARWG